MDHPGDKLSTIDLKRINQRKILDYLRNSGLQSKQDLAYALKMSLPTISQGLKRLEDLGLLKDSGFLDSTGGRKAQAIEFNNNAKLAIGLDITRNHITCVAVNLNGVVLGKTRTKISFSDDPQYYIGLKDIVDSLIESLALDKDRVLGVGIAVPAIVSSDGTQMTYCAVLGIEKGYLNHFARFLTYPCRFFNDANSAGYAEIWNSEPVHDNIVYISLNNSVGGSIIFKDSVFYGRNNRAGEFGHMQIVPGGKRCYCGQLGCLDSYCNAKLLSDCAQGKLDRFFYQVEMNDERSVAVWKEYLMYLASAVNNLRMVFDCDIILGGYVGEYMDAYIDQLRDMLKGLNTFECDGSYVRVCINKQEATAVGSALYYIDSYLGSVC